MLGSARQSSWLGGKDIGTAMAATPFHTLKNAGFTDEQAEAIVFAIQDSLRDNVATKSDLFTVESHLETKIVDLRADIYRALWMRGAGLVMIMVALFTLFRTLG